MRKPVELAMRALAQGYMERTTRYSCRLEVYSMYFGRKILPYLSLSTWADVLHCICGTFEGFSVNAMIRESRSVETCLGAKQNLTRCRIMAFRSTSGLFFLLLGVIKAPDRRCYPCLYWIAYACPRQTTTIDGGSARWTEPTPPARGSPSSAASEWPVQKDDRRCID
jgi:hypothetical protein